MYMYCMYCYRMSEKYYLLPRASLYLHDALSIIVWYDIFHLLKKVAGPVIWILEFLFFVPFHGFILQYS